VVYGCFKIQLISTRTGCEKRSRRISASLGKPSLPAQATPISYVDKSLVKSLRDHLHKKEMLRWHPDHFNKRLTPEREVACMNGRMRIKERAVARVIGETLTTLKKECEKALNTEQSFGSKCFI